MYFNIKFSLNTPGILILCITPIRIHRELFGGLV